MNIKTWIDSLLVEILPMLYYSLLIVATFYAMNEKRLKIKIKKHFRPKYPYRSCFYAFVPISFASFGRYMGMTKSIIFTNICYNEIRIDSHR